MPTREAYETFKKSKCIIAIYDPQFNPLGQLGSITSLVFNRRLRGSGNFELHIPFSEVLGALGKETGAIHLLKPHNILVINGEEDLSGYITDFEILTDLYQGDIVINGRTGQGLCKHKIVVPPKKDEAPLKLGWDRVKGPSETVLKHFLTRHLQDPVNQNRGIANLHIEADLARGIDMVWQARFTSLGEEIGRISEYANIGYEIVADYKNNRWVADTVHGADRTEGNPEGNEPVMFNMSLKNLDRYEYREDRQNYRNVGYAGGVGEDENRLIYVINPEVSGVERREVFLDCGNSDNIDELIYYGKQKMLDYQENIMVDLSVLQKGFTLGTDYFLGDMVSLHIEDLDITNHMTLTGIEYTWQPGDKHRQKLMFGSDSNPLGLLMRPEEVR